MDANTKKRYDKAGPQVVKALEKRHFEAYYVSAAAEAVEKVVELIPKEHTVSWGGTATVDALGIKQRLAQEGIALIDRHRNSCIGGCCQIACDHIFFIELFPHLFGIVFLVLNRIISGLFGINLIIFLIIYYHNRKFFIVNVTG